MKTTGWDHRLAVRADDKNLLGHAGGVLLRRIADTTGLTRALAGAFPRDTGPNPRDRARSDERPSG